MIKHFYSYIIETDSLISELDELNITETQRAHLTALIESNLHHAIVESVLSELSEDDKKRFLMHLHTKNQEKLWKLLNSRIKNIEEKIKKTANDLKKEIRRDIQEVKGSKA